MQFRKHHGGKIGLTFNVFNENLSKRISSLFVAVFDILPLLNMSRGQEGIRNCLTVSSFMPHIQPTCICCIFFSFFDLMLSMNKRFFAFIYDLMLLAFWFLMLHYLFHLFFFLCLKAFFWHACWFFFCLLAPPHIFRTLYFNSRGFWNLYLSNIKQGRRKVIKYIFSPITLTCCCSTLSVNQTPLLLIPQHISRLKHYFSLLRNVSEMFFCCGL